MNSYYSLDQENPYVKTLASHVLLYYVQSQAETHQERLEALQKAAEYCGFNTEVITQNRSTYFKIKDNSWRRFDEFRQEVRNITRGNFEDEVVQIADIIFKYKKLNKKWYHFWK